MRVLIEVLVDIHDPPAAIARARKEYERSVPVVDVDGMTEEEALVVADLTDDELRVHPRRVTPEQAIPDGAAAVLRLVERSLSGSGMTLEQSHTQILRETRGLQGGRILRGRERRSGNGPQKRRPPRAPRGGRSR